MTTLIAPSLQAYADIFHAEKVRQYPAIDAIELHLGYAVPKDRLERAACVLACPLKAHAPNWQHGRVLYAMARAYLVERGQPVTFLDIGTAKGFSALCLQWALDDAHALGQVYSVDVLDPFAFERRNTVFELDGLKTLFQILEPWPESEAIEFLHATGVGWLEQFPGRVHLAFVDGKHTGEVVRKEGKLLATKQHPGDRVLFDDLQISGVADAVRSLSPWYDIEEVVVNDDRRYGMAVRRG